MPIHLTSGVKQSTAVVVSDLSRPSIRLMIVRSACDVKDLRIALDGCYPSFWHTDLVMRTIRTSFRPQLVSRLSPHDLLIRGPFSRGNKRLRITNAVTQLWQGLNKTFYQPLSLHVSSENHSLPNYQSYIQSGCDYGIGHEITTDITYFRSPHWHNYLDLSSDGIDGPEFWPRLGNPIQVCELTSPINWNQDAAYKAAFVCSNMTSERLRQLQHVQKVIPVDGFGKAFNPEIVNHSHSGFLKRDLLRKYQYCLCPENSLAAGYFTEKIPEAYIAGAIPITFCGSNLEIDFSPDSIINLQQFFGETGFNNDAFGCYFQNPTVKEKLLSTPLVTSNINVYIEEMKAFIFNIASVALS